MITRNIFHSLINRQSGASAIEFALIAPIYTILLLVIIEVGLMLIVQNALDAGAREAARFAVTGGASPGLNRDDAIRRKVLDTVEDFGGGLVNRGLVRIRVAAYDEIENINRPEPFIDSNNNGEFDLGEFFEDKNGNGIWDEDQGATNSFGLGGEAVNYIIEYDWQTVLTTFGINGVVTLKGLSSAVNEDFPAAP